VSGPTIYSYVDGNPLSQIDPLGLRGGPGIPGWGGPGPIPKRTGSCPEDEGRCKHLVTLAVAGSCQPGDSSCARAMRAAGLEEPYYVEYKTYSWPCLLTLGLVGKVGVVAAGNMAAQRAGQAGAAAAMAGDSALRQTAGSIVAGGSRVWVHPVTTLAFVPSAIKALFAECECNKE
jgi:hypothetical protein